MAKKPKKITISSLKKKAPKVPPLTCIKIDNVISKLEKIVERKKTLDKKQQKDLVKKLETLREANESLRDGGIYWYEKLKHLLKTR
jgi:FtsZ-binding cell division protein ZapB